MRQIIEVDLSESGMSTMLAKRVKLEEEVVVEAESQVGTIHASVLRKRAARLTPEQRSASARNAAVARWSRIKKAREKKKNEQAS